MSSVWVISRGETGAVRTGTLYESNASGEAVPVDLSQYDSVYVVAKRSETSDAVIDAAVTIDADQVTNKGEFSYTFTADDAAIPVSTAGYLLNFRCMDGTNPTYFPLDRQSARSYGRLIVQAS
jgi:hypothetical protein